MDIATVVGIVTGVGLIVFSILLNSGLELFVNAPGFLIVVGGTIAATLIAYPLNEVFKVFGTLRKVFLFKATDPRKLIKEMVELSIKARRDGLLALDKELSKVNYDFLRKGLQLVVDGVPNPSINNILQIEVVNIKHRHRVGWEIFVEMGKYAPAFGMVGTLIGLIQMLAELSDPSTIGPKMAVALLTTFYGAIIANMFCVPIAVKLQRRSHQEALLNNLVIEAIRSIQASENPKLMEDKLNKFLASNETKKAEKAAKPKVKGKK
ncbi:MAG: motility protein A [Fidelibacterota bacterium]